MMELLNVVISRIWNWQHVTPTTAHPLPPQPMTLGYWSLATPTTVCNFYSEGDQIGQNQGVFDDFLFYPTRNLAKQNFEPANNSMNYCSLYWLPVRFSLLATLGGYLVSKPDKFQVFGTERTTRFSFFLHCPYMLNLYAFNVCSIHMFLLSGENCGCCKSVIIQLPLRAALDLNGKSKVFSEQLCERRPLGN